MSECTHTLQERCNDCMDGGCTFCLTAELDRLRAELIVAYDTIGGHEDEIERLRAELAKHEYTTKALDVMKDDCEMLSAENDRLRAENAELEEQLHDYRLVED